MKPNKLTTREKMVTNNKEINSEIKLNTTSLYRLFCERRLPPDDCEEYLS